MTDKVTKSSSSYPEFRLISLLWFVLYTILFIAYIGWMFILIGGSYCRGVCNDEFYFITKGLALVTMLFYTGVHLIGYLGNIALVKARSMKTYKLVTRLKLVHSFLLLPYYFLASLILNQSENIIYIIMIGLVVFSVPTLGWIIGLLNNIILPVRVDRVRLW